MLMNIRVRFALAKILQNSGLSGTPSRDSGTFSSKVYYEGVSNTIPYIKAMKLNPEHGAFFAIYTMLCIEKAKKQGLGTASTELIREQYNYEMLYSENDDFEMNILQDLLKYRYGQNIPWNNN